MKFRNIFWGVMLIFAGVLFILQNLGLADFDWVSLWRLWPVFLVLWGVSIIPVNDWIKVILVLVILGASLTFMLNRTEFSDRPYHFEFFSDKDWDDEYDSSNSDSRKYSAQSFVIPYDDSSRHINLNLEAAAGKFIIEGETPDLLSFDRRGNSTEYSYMLKTTDSSSTINIEMENTSVSFGRKNKNNVDIRLNTLPIWTVSLEAGAAAVDFDLTDYKINLLTVEGSAASIKLKLGDKYKNTNVDLDAGASSIVIKVPETSGCKLSLESVLSGKNLQGFEKIDRGEYETANFDEAINKVYIDAEAAVSSFTIIRY